MVAVPERAAPQRQLIEGPYPGAASIHSARPEDDAPRLERSKVRGETVGARASDQQPFTKISLVA